MKRFIFIIMIFFVISCASSPKKRNYVTLDRALDQAAEEINAALPQGKCLAIMKFDSEAPGLSSYIMEELTGRLVKIGKLTMVDRLNIEYIKNELAFQFSGEVSDESTQAVEMLGAQSIALGSLSKLGNNYRLRFTVVEVESAVNEAAIVLDVRGGRNYTTLLTTLKEGKKVADVSYREKELDRIPKTAIDYLNRGIMFALQLDFDTALLDFNDAIKLDQNMALAYLQRGKTLFIKQEEDVEIDSNFDFTLLYETRKKTQNDDLAIVDFNRTIELNPDLVGAWRYRGRLFQQIGEYDKAISDYTQYIRRRPDDATGYRRRGIAYRDMGAYDQAVADFIRFMNIDPDNKEASYLVSDTYCRIGDLLYREGGYSTAIVNYEKAINYFDNYSALIGLGNSFYMLKEYDIAIQYYNGAVKISPYSDYAFFWIGMSYYSKGAHDLAIANFFKALEINPSNEEYQEWLQIARYKKAGGY